MADCQSDSKKLKDSGVEAPSKSLKRDTSNKNY